jgi:hypothetical protein
MADVAHSCLLFGMFRVWFVVQRLDIMTWFWQWHDIRWHCTFGLRVPSDVGCCWSTTDGNRHCFVPSVTEKDYTRLGAFPDCLHLRVQAKPVSERCFSCTLTIDEAQKKSVNESWLMLAPVFWALSRLHNYAKNFSARRRNALRYGTRTRF